jgi:predicted O-linked N-acetylglucosamine transferase (SPINDLY family)
MYCEADMEALAADARAALLCGATMLALNRIDRILNESPCNAAALHLSGIAYAQQRDYERAASALEAAIALAPQNKSWNADLGAVYSAVNNWRCATRAFQKAPKTPATTLGLARALIGLKRFDEAAAALAEQPESPAHRLRRLRLLAEICYARGEWETARTHCLAVLAQKPEDDNAVDHLIGACWEMGDLDAAIEYARPFIRNGRGSMELRMFYPYLLLFSNRQTLSSIRAAHEEFAQWLFPGQPAPRGRPQADNHGRRLRVGYLTGEFTAGAAFHFLSPLLGNHNPGEIEMFSYHTRPRRDRQTEWFRSQGHWRDCSHLDDEAIKDHLRRDEIDILVDLSGLFPNNRLKIFAQRTCPIQVAYPNYAATTGVSEMDYIFTDRWTCPPGRTDQYVEEAVMLPGGLLAYAPLEEAPSITALPARRNGLLTFGLFQRTAKMNSDVFDAVAAILSHFRNSRLLIQIPDYTLDDPDSGTRRWLIRQLTARGVEERRLDVRGARTQLETMTIMGEADIALDTFPFQGQTTTCECLWMGVPVIARSGQAHVARVGSAILHRAGLGHLAVNTVEEYIASALSLAGDLTTLADLRVGMRERLRETGILDGRRLAREVETAYRWMWRRAVNRKEK